MKVTAKVTFLHDQLGRVAKGAQVEVTDRQLRQLKGLGWIVESDQKPAPVVAAEPKEPKRSNKKRG